MMEQETNTLSLLNPVHPKQLGHESVLASLDLLILHVSEYGRVVKENLPVPTCSDNKYY